ncbi:MAG: aminotransferase class IV [Actinomycetota bacterium]|nr:aminotransferase class IV [Actinomycetota bacterium]
MSEQPSDRPPALIGDPRQGVFETVLVLGGLGVELRAHLDRMDRGVRALYRQELPRELPAAVHAKAQRAEQPGRIRLWVRPARGLPLQHSVDIHPASRHLLNTHTHPGAELAVVVTRHGLGPHKLVDRSILGRWRGAHDATGTKQLLLADPNGAVLETERANVFAVVEGILITPCADGRILAGVARAATLSIAHDLCIPTAIAPLSLERLGKADEVFLTNSIGGIQPVMSCDDLGRWTAGAVTLRLRHALAARWLGQALAHSRKGASQHNGGQRLRPAYRP